MQTFFDSIISSREEEARRLRPAGAVAGSGVGVSCHSSSGTGSVTITGRVSSASDEPVEGASVYVIEQCVQAATTDSGTFRLTMPRPEGDSITLRVRAIGFRPGSRRLAVQDSTRALIKLAADINGLEQIVVTGVMEGSSGVSSITNNQHAGVDEGGIVKLHGDHLVVLRRGRLFTVSLRGMRPVASIDAFAPGLEPGSWYDEMLIHDDKVIVIGYNYRRGGTEVGIFRIDRLGNLAHDATWHLTSNDYYSSRNYASRLVGSRLVFYSPTYMHLRRGTSPFPTLRRWVPGTKAQFRPIVSAQRVYRPAHMLSAVLGSSLHTVTTCDLAAAELRCEGTVVMGPASEVFYVSPRAVYVWMSGYQRWGSTTSQPALVVRMPFDGEPPTAIGAEGGPVDQFSFLESEDGYLNVLVRGQSRGDWMWQGERAAGAGNLLRIPLIAFGDGSEAAHASWYRALPVPGGYSMQNRFVGDYLVYGAGSGWNQRGHAEPAYLVPWRGGALTKLHLRHGVDRIEVMGAQAVIIGERERDLHFTGIRLETQPRIGQRYVLADASQGESRSHGFFYRVDAADAGVIGLPVARAGRPGRRHLAEGSAAVIYLRNSSRRFTPLGELAATELRSSNDGCVASCVDWYGNARPVFIGRRVFALLGYELVEGRLDRGMIEEVARVDYTPRQTTSRR